MTPRLSPLTQQLIEALFEPGDRTEAARLMVEECGNGLPLYEDADEYELERIRFAALRLSIGYLEDLRKAIQIGKSDWRDLLVWGGFGESPTEHQEWAEQTLQRDLKPIVIILMGLPGAGKTTVGSMLARSLGWMYYETDNFLATQDFNHMIRGEALEDEAIEAWLGKIRALIAKYVAKNQTAIFACSALKESQRQRLRVSQDVHFIYLRGPQALLEERQRTRKSRLPHLARLAYQASIFEEPQDVLTLDIDRAAREIVIAIRQEFGL